MNKNNWLLIGVVFVLAWAVVGRAESDFSQFIANRTLQGEAQELEIDGKYVKAAKRYLKLAKRTSDPKNQAGWTLRAADCYCTANKSHKALELYKNLLANAPFFVPYEHVVGKLRIIAERFVDGEGTFLGIRDKQTAISIYELIIQEAPSIHVSLQDRLRMVELLKETERLEEAVNAYQAILKLDPGLDDVRLDLAILLSELSKIGDGDGTKLRAAVRHAEAVKENQPEHPRRKEIDLLLRDAREQDAQRLLDLGQFYLRPSHRRTGAARRYLLDVLRDYPDTQAGWEAKKILDDNPSLRDAPAVNDDDKPAAKP
ncbi:MAG TPA: hypothetical protein PLT23_02580 [Lentisphaeria bacterium]|nr:hypothetical protein [Lentisphaerota bacterium]OQC17031.1 MAG: hypothetical protein BWX73_00552 [Lentisphaerae bacterium ADurb.Bin082]HPY89582.1 hypothetical protein [Lentisphaeria bacterium]HQL86062.1 hypothetical protein [Lentisphaeria bacterium]